MRLELMNLALMESPLLKYARNVNSQFGEDGIIEHIFGVLKPESKMCVEFGAWDGKHFSNCNNLVENHGWGGVMIEADAGRFPALQKTYAGYPSVSCVNRLVHFDGPNSLDAILAERPSIPQSFGLLSIDIDGNDYHIWESLRNFTPDVVVIEFNPTVPNDVIFVQDRSMSVTQGSSLLAFVMLGYEKGYKLAVCTDTNAFFVRKDKFPLLGVTNNSIWALYKPDQDGRIFYGQDGTIFVVGMTHMIWHDREVSSADFQILPEAQRVWGDAKKD